MTVKSLVFRAAAPQQSWGLFGTQTVRPTSPLPTYSGVSGLLRAALGLPRGELPEWDGELDMVVRVDQLGRIESDFQTVRPLPEDIIETQSRALAIDAAAAGKSKARTSPAAGYVVPRADGTPWVVGGGVEPHVSRRHFIADGEFIIAVSHRDPDVVDELGDALMAPTFQIYLGRKAYIPTFPFHLGVHAGAPTDVLAQLPRFSPRASERPRIYRVDVAGHERIGTIQTKAAA